MTLHTHYPELLPLGDQCWLVRFGNTVSEDVNHSVIEFANRVVESQLPGVIEVVPSYCEVAVYYNALAVDHSSVFNSLKALLNELSVKRDFQRHVHRIPVCYGGAFGPDLAHVAKHNGISEEEVIRVHTGSIYPVYMLGFTPGFCYLGNLSGAIHCLRKSRPRLKIPAGSVGIAGKQTGIYPIESPGGWQLIGQTPLTIFDINRIPNVLVEAGEAIQFYAIDEEQFYALKKNGDANE